MSSPTHDDLVAAVAAEGVRDPRLLAAIRALPRADFVSADQLELATDDRPLPIAHEQVTTQPSLVARMVEALGLRGRERVLEIGTGSGWQTAILARLAGYAWSVERWPDLAEAAGARLVAAGVDNAAVVLGDGSEGLSDHAPYDAIVVSAAFPSVPEPVVAQLAAGGRLVQPLGHGGAEEVVLFEKLGDRLVRRRTVTGAHFVRLYGSHGFRP